MATLGVDLGTWSVAAILVDDRGRRPVTDPVSGQAWSRSAVALAPDGGWLFGQAAEEMRAARPESFRDDLKRLLGSDRPVYLDGQPHAVVNLLALLLERCRAQAAGMTNESIDALVLGIPVSFEGARADALREAARQVGFGPGAVSLVPEPLAAARAAFGPRPTPGRWLVFDLGGGTFDAALVEVDDDATLAVLDTTGDATIGGHVIDEAITDHLRQAFGLPEPGDDDLREQVALLAAARTMKHQLSGGSTGYASNPFPAGPRQLTLSLDVLREITTPVVDIAVARSEVMMLAAAGVGWSDLDGVIPTGGATRSPAVLARLKERGIVVPATHPAEVATVHGLIPPDPPPREPEPETFVPPSTSANVPPSTPLSAWAGVGNVPITAATAWSLENVVSLSGHTGEVLDVTFSPDGRFIATASEDETLGVWDAVTGELLHRLSGHNDWVNSVRFSPDSRTIASGSDKKKVRVWDAVTGAQRFVLAGHDDEVNAVAFSPHGVLATASDDETIRLWNYLNGAHLGVLELQSSASAVVFSPDGSLLMGASSYQILVWNMRTSELLTVLYDHDDTVNQVAFSPDGRTFASASNDETVRVWDARGLSGINTLHHKKDMGSVAWAPTGDLLATGTPDGDKVRLWRTADFGRVAKLDHFGAWINALAFSPDGCMLACGTDENDVEIWRVG